LGGNTITIYGQGLPKKIDGNSITLYFDNSRNTKCNIFECGSGFIKCETERFDKFTEKDMEFSLSLEVNGKSHTCPNKLRTKTMNIAVVEF
jgi:hypothetical protein